MKKGSPTSDVTIQFQVTEETVIESGNAARGFDKVFVRVGGHYTAAGRSTQIFRFSFSVTRTW